jgi:hypothetical protein
MASSVSMVILSMDANAALERLRALKESKAVADNPAFDPQSPQSPDRVPPAYATRADEGLARLRGLSTKKQVDSGAGAQIGAGLDTAHALAWEAGNQLASYSGWKGSGFQEYAEQQAKANMAEAEAVPAFTLGDQLLRGVGTIAGVVPAIAAGGLAGMATPVAGITGGTGLAAAGVISSFGLNLGDEAFKAKKYNPDFEIGASDIGVNAALGFAELVPAMKMFRAFKLAKPALGESFLKSLAKASPGFAGSVALGGATEGVQDFVTGAKAMSATDTEFTKERVDGLLDSMRDEAIIGGLLVGPIAGIQSVGEIATAMSPERVKWNTDADGNITDFTYDAPTTGVANDPGLVRGIKSGISTAFGNATDKLGIHMPKNIPIMDEAGNQVGSRLSKWQIGAAKIVQDEFSRAQLASQGEFTTTQDVNESIIKSDLNRDAHTDFYDAPESVRNAARDDKAQGLRVASAPEQQAALDAIWAMDTNLRREAADVQGVRFRGDTYVPFNPNKKAVKENPAQFLDELKVDLMTDTVDRPAMTEEEATAYIEGPAAKWVSDIVNYESEFIENEASNKTAAFIQEAYAKVGTITDPAKRAAAGRKVNFRLKHSVIPKINKNNPLEQARGLEKASDAFLQKHNDITDAGEQYRAHTNAIAARLAHIRNWGENNEKYWQWIGDSIQEALDMGMSVPSDFLEKSVDLLNVLQKQPIKKVSGTAKNAMENLRFYQNVTKLPLAIIPSITESLFVLDKYGAVDGLTTMGKLTWGGMMSKAKGRQLPTDVQKFFNSLNMSMKEATSIMASRVSEETFAPKKWESKFFNVTLLPQFTEALRMLAAFQAEKSIQTDIETIKNTDGKASQGAIQQAARKLYQAGLNPNDAMMNNTKFSEDPQSYYMKHIRPATIALAEDIVVHPSPSKKPLWHSDPRLMLVAHMKSFATVFTNTVMKTWWRNMTTGTAPENIAYAVKLFPVVATFVAMNAGLAGLREWIRTGDTEKWDKQTFAQSALAGASYLGAPGMGLESVHRAGWGQSAVESVLGPSAGEVSKITRVVSKAFDDPVAALNELLGNLVPSMPGQGYIRQVIDEGLDSGN